jgi:predicted glycoside hydrolase/deacetylase ChbG (UPF0249 family)
MKQLIVNADDYGRSPEISRGIREAHLKGIVTSTTCMMNIPTTAEDIAIAVRESPNLGMGVHLVLTMGKPLLPREKVPTIVDENGNNRKYDPFIENVPNLKMEEVKAEWRAQIEAFIKAAGKRPTHLDSHHHSSFFSPALFRTMLELADEYGCPIRYPILPTNKDSREFSETAKYAADILSEFHPRKPDVFFVNFYDETATKEQLLNILDLLSNGTSEIMCHPGHVDEAFAKESVYNFQRARELQILTSLSIKDAIEAREIKLITFAELK